MSAPAPVRPAYPVISDPARPACHFGPPAQWMNDPNGAVWHAGWWHVFYQHNPHGDAWADMHWGHARSCDLIHWEHLPLALRPQRAAGELHCYSGCLAFTTTEEPRILYTSVPPPDTRAATQVIATPDDPAWQAWTQHVASPALDLATHDGPAFDPDWRDPFVFHADGRTFLILGSTLGDDTVIPIYENPAGDLRHWHFRGILHREPRHRTPFLECPNLIRCGERWLLLTSSCRGVEWHSGTLDLGKYAFRTEQHGRVDESVDYYATHPATDPVGRTVLFGWARNFPAGRGWNGCLAVPRRIGLDETGAYWGEPAAEFAALRLTETPLPAQPIAADPLVIALPPVAQCEGELVIGLPSGATVTIGLPGLAITVGPAGVAFGARPPAALRGRPVQVRWFLDGALLEVFVNRELACTQVVPFPGEGTLRLAGTAGATHLLRGSVWTLRPAPATFG